MSDPLVLRFADRRVRVVARTSAGATIVERLRVVFAPFVSAVKDAGEPLEIVAHESGDDPLGRTVLAVSTAALAAAPERWAVHAAACTFGGHTLVLPAGSGRGKSTLVAHLLARGATLLSDEVAWLEPPSFAVHPFPRTIVLEPGAVALDAAARAAAGIADAGPAADGAVALRLPADRIATAAAPAPSVLVFPSFEPGAAPLLAPLSRARAAAGLLELTLHAPAPGPAAPLDLAETLVRAAPCFAARYGSSADALALVESALATAVTTPAGAR